MRPAHHRGQLGHERRWATGAGRVSTEAMATRPATTRPGTCRPRRQPPGTTWGTARTRRAATTAPLSACLPCRHHRHQHRHPHQRHRRHRRHRAKRHRAHRRRARPRQRPTPARWRSSPGRSSPGRCSALGRSGLSIPCLSIPGFSIPGLKVERSAPERASRLRRRARGRPSVPPNRASHPGSAPASTGRSSTGASPLTLTSGPIPPGVPTRPTRCTGMGSRTSAATKATTTIATAVSPAPSEASRPRRRGVTAPPRCGCGSSPTSRPRAWSCC